jgi:hypothetical protein
LKNIEAGQFLGGKTMTMKKADLTGPGIPAQF